LLIVVIALSFIVGANPFSSKAELLRWSLSRVSVIRSINSIRMASSTNINETATKCVPCSSMDTKALLSWDEVDEQLQSTPVMALWKQEMLGHEKSIPTLRCRFTAKNFQAAMDALNAMGVIAEREQHHPNFHLTNYRDVQVDIYTHKVSGVTSNDIALARMISEEVAVSYSPQWIKNHPEAPLPPTAS
jgi:4a-hydroxytetrahydrobiopterin dehydratase